jgi:hypothetical protein
VGLRIPRLKRETWGTLRFVEGTKSGLYGVLTQGLKPKIRLALFPPTIP